MQWQITPGEDWPMIRSRGTSERHNAIIHSRGGRRSTWAIMTKEHVIILQGSAESLDNAQVTIEGWIKTHSIPAGWAIAETANDNGN